MSDTQRFTRAFRPTLIKKKTETKTQKRKTKTETKTQKKSRYFVSNRTLTTILDADNKVTDRGIRVVAQMLAKAKAGKPAPSIRLKGTRVDTYIRLLSKMLVYN